MNQYHFLVLGDDARQKFLAEILAERGHEVMRANAYLPGYHDAVLLPIPQTAQYLEENSNCLQKGQIVYGCNFPRALVEEGDEKGVHFIDYMKISGVAEKNAVATAEGAIAEALKEADVCIHGSRCLVVGYGRCGEVLAEKLTALRADVTVMERKYEKRARAESFGCRAVSFNIRTADFACEVCGACGPLFEEGAEQIQEADFIFNTVPAPVLTEELLARAKKEVKIIDIASAPGGTDFAYCQKRGIFAKLCPGLPGKYAPKSSARILVEVIGKTILGER